MSVEPFGGRRLKAYWLIIVFLNLIIACLLNAQPASVANRQDITGYPPSIYMQTFFPCSADTPCTRTEDFRVDPLPNGCCILTVTNGDGRGRDEVRSYEVFLNGERIVSADHSPNVRATVKVLHNNTIKVILIGGPHSKVWIFISYDPRQSK